MIIGRRYIHCMKCGQVTLAEKHIHWDDTKEEICSKCGINVEQCEDKQQMSE